MYSVLQDTLIATYADLVRTFGEPDSEGDGYKTDVEWSITFPSGVIATIYNWKNGRAYCGEAGQPVESITDWRISGSSYDAVFEVTRALDTPPILD